MTLSLADICAGYGDVEVIKSVSLRVQRGERVGIIGVNGSGKSTLLKVVSGHVVPSKGRVRWEDEDIPLGQPWLRLRNGILSVPQDRALFGPLSVRDNLRVAALAAKRKFGSVLDDASAWMPDLQRRLSLRADRLSGGEYRRLSLGLAMACAPSLLLLDEPAVGLDPSGRRQLFADLAKYVAHDTTLLIVEQDIHSLCKLATRVCLLADGALAKEWNAPLDAAQLIRRLLGAKEMDAQP